MKNINKEYTEKWSSVLDIVNDFKSQNFISLHEKINKININSKLNKFIKNDWYIYKNKIKNISLEKIYLYKHLFLTNILIQKISDFDEIIELGSGWGSRILYINEILNKQCYSGEINISGIETQKEIIKKCKLENVKCFHFDYNNFNNSVFKFKLNNPVIITCNSVEQIEYLSQSFYADLKKYFNVKEIQIIHLEPIGFQFEPKSKLDQRHEDYNKKNKYNLNLSKIIKNIKVKKFEINKNILTCENSNETIFSPMSLISLKY